MQLTGLSEIPSEAFRLYWRGTDTLSGTRQLPPPKGFSDPVPATPKIHTTTTKLPASSRRAPPLQGSQSQPDKPTNAPPSR